MTVSHTHLDLAPARVVLARRRNAGLLVTLLWARETNSLAVQVDDTGLDHQFEVAVEPGASPLDVFEHPFAYAAWCGVDYATSALKDAA
jgi:hypothetical protein